MQSMQIKITVYKNVQISFITIHNNNNIENNLDVNQ